jgi:phage-related baseplate assembly protein
MDIEEFVTKVQPGKKINRLKKYEGQIKKLKSDGYTDQQVREWLATVGVEISREAVRRFAKRITADQPTSHSYSEVKANPTPSTPAKDTEILSNAEKLRKRLQDQKSEAEGHRFKHDKNGNT